MHILIKTSVVALTLAVLAGCQNHVENAEMNPVSYTHLTLPTTPYV